MIVLQGQRDGVEFLHLLEHKPSLDLNEAIINSKFSNDWYVLNFKITIDDTFTLWQSIKSMIEQTRLTKTRPSEQAVSSSENITHSIEVSSQVYELNKYIILLSLAQNRYKLSQFDVSLHSIPSE
ncbi:unnamed protein product [Rhizopus stolonifer]